EYEGVYNLPEAQVDRFMIKIPIGYPDREEEILLLKRKEKGEFGSVKKIVDLDEVKSLVDKSSRIRASEEILDYIYEISLRTRNDERVLLGASPRAAEHLLFASKSLAFLRGRDYVIPDDIKELAVYVLSHRIKVKAEYEVDGLKAEDVVKEILDEVEVPK
ncbi:magnesium chelatase, partial [Candidatus Geothermarchaeota archaeon]